MIKDFIKDFNYLKFQEDLITWYEANKRDLPWRKTKDPYLIWISEIMLQQTQVNTVIPYFENFKSKYPSVKDLAEADEQEVLKDWEGLGYYSRARNLHAAVKEVASKYNGIVPSNLKDLGDLKGIGPYTKGAIASIAFNKPEPAVDGNVMRVLSRVLLITENISEAKTKKIFENIIYKIISQEDPSSFNQGLMELGATVCTPRQPLCLHCPVREHCKAFEQGIQTDLPIKNKAKKQRIEHYSLVLLRDNTGKIAIEKRPNEGLLANMWQFPMIRTDQIKEENLEEWFYGAYGVKIKQIDEHIQFKHVFSHIIWELKVIDASLIQDDASELTFVNKEKLANYPFSVSHIKAMPYI